MGEFSVEGTELKKLVKVAKKRPLAFAVAPGTDGDSFFFALHKRLAPEIVARGVKKESGINKIAYGLCSVESKEMVLTCQRELPALAKRLKKWLKKQKAPYNVKILDENGNVIDTDIEDLPDDALYDEEPDVEDGEGTGDDGPDPAAQELHKRILSLVPDIRALNGPARTKLQAAAKAALDKNETGETEAAAKLVAAIEADLRKRRAVASPETGKQDGQTANALVERLKDLRPRCQSTPPPANERLMKAWGLAAEKLRGKDFAGVEAALKAIEAALAENPVTDPLQQQWETLWGRLSPVLLKALNADLPDAQRMRAAMHMADEAASVGDYKKAIAIANRLEEALKTSLQKHKEQASASDSALVDFTKTRLLWSRARSLLKAEIDRLGKEIVSACDGEDFEGIENAVGDLQGYLDPIDEKLEDALDDLIQEADPVKRGPLRRKCHAVIGDYVAELNSGIFTIIDDGNGFVSGLKVRKVAVAALDAVAKELDREKEPVA
ncbi:hypothetical protein [Phaeobacter sp. B1627]|uniref:hypothetical protein n=1 Tax=Phaeobacter sp. B1627 TaxID=2583809 RepID=UPI001119E6DF|nr:hypothetical protein [Phaeobacter sp. B1627]TNJ48376.1 hypothetical protein FGE21_00030 [Phaeobacter sp. B1627]